MHLGGGSWDETRLAELLSGLNRSAAGGLRFLAAGVLPAGSPSLNAAVERTAWLATLPERHAAGFAALDAACRGFLARDTAPWERRRHDRTFMLDLRPFVHDLAALDDRRVVLELGAAKDGSARPTEILEAACGVPRHLLPLINIHRTDARIAGGGSPLDACAPAVGEETVEKGNSDQWEPAGDPRGDSRGRHPC